MTFTRARCLRSSLRRRERRCESVEERTKRFSTLGKSRKVVVSRRLVCTYDTSGIYMVDYATTVQYHEKLYSTKTEKEKPQRKRNRRPGCARSSGWRSSCSIPPCRTPPVSSCRAVAGSADRAGAWPLRGRRSSTSQGWCRRAWRAPSAAPAG